jgi:hypothetical protein
MLGAAAAPVALAGYTIGIDKDSGDDYSAFNFTCSCGNGLVARVPKEVGGKVLLNCDCGLQWDMEWTGGGFKTKMLNQRPEDRLYIE